MGARKLGPEEHLITDEPFYPPLGDEIEVFEDKLQPGITRIAQGPHRLWQARFIECMAWKLMWPLITVSCHDDLTASDPLCRYLNQLTQYRLGGRLADPGGARQLLYLD